MYKNRYKNKKIYVIKKITANIAKKLINRTNNIYKYSGFPDSSMNSVCELCIKPKYKRTLDKIALTKDDIFNSLPMFSNYGEIEAGPYTGLGCEDSIQG